MNKITTWGSTRVVKVFGGSGHVIVPKELIGRLVKIELMEE